MDIALHSPLKGPKRNIWRNFLERVGLSADETVDSTVLVWDEETLVATGSRQDNLLKCIAVAPDRQGEGLLATVLTALRQDAFRAGFDHLFLYTKPVNANLFAPLFFYPVAATGDVLLMEDRQNGIHDFLAAIPKTSAETVGAVVMNCDPFTLGHLYLIETAAKSCEHLYVFVLSEDKGCFPAADRLELVKRGTAHIPNVTVCPTGPYLISSATFPTYFLKDRDQATQIHCQLDLEIFTRHFAPVLGITRRFVGTEPLSVMTNQYNDVLKATLPTYGITVTEIPRLTVSDVPISAGAVRAAWCVQDWQLLEKLVPETTLAYLKNRT
ncbi:MAG: [citrate (pro-3S)-lyase] ligase [Ruminococcaceae bacterium]|nr:[citrate (pro-3S)-lyase] ligase [Oscillospiraceae bacterium]